MKLNILHGHPTGNRFSREAVLAFHAIGFLGAAHTSIAPCKGNFFAFLARLPGFSDIERRRFPDELSSKLHLHPLMEVLRLISLRMGFQLLVKHETGPFSVDAIYKSFDAQLASAIKYRDDITDVYCYEDGALETFRLAKKQGLRCWYDLPIAHWQTARHLLEQEAERYPNWAQTLMGNFDSIAKCARKDEELSLADHVICPSEFVSRSLPEPLRWNKAVHVVPFGSPSVPLTTKIFPRHDAGKLKILFVGSMTQRKGLADLFAAIKLLDPDKFELHVLGSPVVDLSFYIKECPSMIYHRPRPNDQVLALMSKCHVFVLPSIVEGRALVQQEALAMGLPIVVTRNAGGEDLVEGKKTGFLVPIRDPESIAQSLQSLQADPDLRSQMSLNASKIAALLSWEEYRKNLQNLIRP